MPELAAILERESRSVDVEPGGFERLRRRRARRQRNRRLGSAFVAIVLTVATIGYAFAAFHRRSEPQPVDKITTGNVADLGVSWSAPLYVGTTVVRDGLVYSQTRASAMAPTTHMEARPLDCATSDQSCPPVWRTATGPYGSMLIGSKFAYAGTGEAIAAFPLTCSKQPCRPAWTGTLRGSLLPTCRSGCSSVQGAPSPAPVTEIGDRVYVGGLGGLAAFATSCEHALCRAVWAALDVGPPVAVGEMIVARSADAIEAFGRSCWESKGPTKCPTEWIARMGAPPGGLRNEPPVVVDGHVIGFDSKGITVFLLHCRGECSPEWRASIPGGVGFPPVAAHGMIFDASAGGLELYAYPLQCGSRDCAPTWTGHVDEGVGYQPTVTPNEVLVATTFGDTLTAFPRSCSTVCNPSWVAPLADSIVFPPVEQDGLVFVSGLQGLTVFQSGCSQPCAPLFHWSVPTKGMQASPVLSGHSVVLYGNDETYVLDTDSGTPTRSEPRTPPPYGLVVFGAIVGTLLIWRRRRVR